MIDFLTNVLFESLPWLLFFCMIAVTVAVGVHRTRYTRRSRRAFWITLTLCAVLVILQQMVVTDREALERAVRTLTRAVDEGDVGTIADHLDTGFRLGGQDRDEFIESVNRTLQTCQIDEARVSGVQARVDGDKATVMFNGWCDVRRGGDIQYNFPTRWQLGFVRRAGRWLLDRIDQARWELPVGGAGGDIQPYFR